MIGIDWYLLYGLLSHVLPLQSMIIPWNNLSSCHPSGLFTRTNSGGRESASSMVVMVIPGLWKTTEMGRFRRTWVKDTGYGWYNGTSTLAPKSKLAAIWGLQRTLYGDVSGLPCLSSLIVSHILSQWDGFTLNLTCPLGLNEPSCSNTFKQYIQKWKDYERLANSACHDQPWLSNVSQKLRQTWVSKPVDPRLHDVVMVNAWRLAMHMTLITEAVAARVAHTVQHTTISTIGWNRNPNNYITSYTMISYDIIIYRTVSIKILVSVLGQTSGALRNTLSEDAQLDAHLPRSSILLGLQHGCSRDQSPRNCIITESLQIITTSNIKNDQLNLPNKATNIV